MKKGPRQASKASSGSSVAFDFDSPIPSSINVQEQPQKNTTSPKTTNKIDNNNNNDKQSSTTKSPSISTDTSPNTTNTSPPNTASVNINTNTKSIDATFSSISNTTSVDPSSTASFSFSANTSSHSPSLSSSAPPPTVPSFSVPSFSSSDSSSSFVSSSGTNTYESPLNSNPPKSSNGSFTSSSASAQLDSPRPHSPPTPFVDDIPVSVSSSSSSITSSDKIFRPSGTLQRSEPRTSKTSNGGNASVTTYAPRMDYSRHRSDSFQRDQEIERLTQEIASLKQQINTINRADSNRASSNEYAIRPCYTYPEEQWADRMLEGQRQVEELYNSIGSRLEVLPLLDPEAHIIVDNERDDTQLALEEFCARYAPLVQDAHTQASIQEHINTLRSNPAGPVRGHKIGAINAIGQLLRIKSHRTCIIICGHESAGKTTLLECLIGCRLGYSDAGRATVCPVIYTFVYKEGETPYFQHGATPVALEQCAHQELSRLPDFVRQHMERIKSVAPGISRDELLVKIVSGDIRYAGIIVDCPGTTISPQGAANAEEELNFKEAVKEIIAEQVKQANPHNSVILCLERKSLDQTQGGCGHFYNEVLSATRGFANFQSRVKMVFNYNDHQCRGKLQNAWTEEFDHVDDVKDYLRTYKVIHDNFFKLPPPLNSIFFISMKHVQDLYGNVTDESELEHMRERLLAQNSHATTQIITATDPLLARTFDAEYRFSFANLKDSIFDEMERSSDKYVRKMLDAVEQFRDSVQKRKDLLTAIANDESRYDNEGVVREAWEGFLKKWSELAQEEQQSTSGLPIIDLHFDDDEWCRMFHEQFPLELSFAWPKKFLKENGDQSLRRFLEIHKVDIQYEDFETVHGMLMEHVDLFSSKKVNLVSAYERMIDSMSCRLATVHLNFIKPDEFHHLLGSIHTRGIINNPSEAAYRWAIKVLEMFYVQFLAYFKTILVHFFQRAIDVALYLMRIGDPNNVPYVAKYKTPLATFRKVLFDAVEHWADRQIGKFYETIPVFKNSDAENIEAKYREFAETVQQLKVGNNESLPQEMGALLCNKLLEVVSKNTLAQEAGEISTIVKDFDASGAKVQEVVLKTYAIHNANMIRRFREEFRYEQIHRIFGDNHKNQTPDHMKSMLEGYCKFCLVHLPYISFRHPPGPRLQSTESLVFVQPRNKAELDAYLGALYGITDETARGSQRQIGVLGKLVETFT